MHTLKFLLVTILLALLSSNSYGSEATRHLMSNYIFIGEASKICSKALPESGVSFLQSYEEWISKHKKEIEVTFLIEKSIDIYFKFNLNPKPIIKHLSALELTKKRQMCISTFKAVSSGRVDLINEKPEHYKTFQEIINEGYKPNK